jgi:prepilin-type N-terminal cleavage/methylation domain-containing protein
MHPVFIPQTLRRRALPAGFSLIEVLLCIAILPVAFSGLLCLLGISLSQCRESAEATDALQLSQLVFASLRTDPFHASPLFHGLDQSSLSLGARTPEDPAIKLYAWTQKPPPPESNPTPAVPDPTFPVIRRTYKNHQDANYLILLRFEPVGRGGSSKENSCRGTTVGIHILQLPSQRTVFQASQFIARGPVRTTGS